MSEDRKEMITAIVQGNVKSLPGIVINNFVARKEFDKIFIDAGHMIAEYEKSNRDEYDLRRILFSEMNMKTMANHMYHVDDFSWTAELEKCLDEFLSGSEMPEDDRFSCKKHFCEMIEAGLRHSSPQMYERNMIAEGQSKLQEILQQNQGIHEILCRIEEGKEQPRQRHSEDGFVQRGQSTFEVPKWNIEFIDVQGVFKPKKEWKKEILELIDKWSKERESEPGWYILPYSLCNELHYKTKENGLLQSHSWIDAQIMLRFSYELVWRYEKCFHWYSKYEITHIYKIWINYLTEFDESKKDDIRKWFYVGQALLRIFRETGQDREWKKVHKQLRLKEEYGTNGCADLQLEKIKYEFHHLNISGMRREIGRVHLQKEQYEQRLQLLGLQVECGEVAAVIPKLKALIAELEAEKADDRFDKWQVSRKTLKACALQLLSLTIQSDSIDESELHQGELNILLNQIDEQKSLFDCKEWESFTESALLKWQSKKYGENECYDLNRETRTIISGESRCYEAYWFYRLMDRLALPVKCGYIKMLGSMEQPWINALQEFDVVLSNFMLIRSNHLDNIKHLVNRDYITALDCEDAERIVRYLLEALEINLEELNGLQRTQPRSIAFCIADAVPQLLTRYMSRCPEELQEKAMLILKKLAESEELPVWFPLVELQVGIMEGVSEKKKAQMLGTMMETEIVEHRTLMGQREGIDLFDYYFQKIYIGPLKDYCQVTPSIIEKLLRSTSDNIYEWRAKVTRLELLDRLGLLNQDQKHKYAELLWERVDEKTGLPDLPNMHLSELEQLPSIDPSIPVQSVKAYFLRQKLKDLLVDKEVNSMTMGRIPYLDELIFLCRNRKQSYWSENEADQIINNILEYWDYLEKSYTQVHAGTLVEEEFLSRASKIEMAIAEICKNTSEIGSSIIPRIKLMIEKMQTHGISTKTLEVVIAEDNFPYEKILEEMLSPDHELTIGALNAAYEYMNLHTNRPESQKLLEGVVRILQYRKQPGLESAIWLIHNLVYERNPIMEPGNRESVDGQLYKLAEALKTSEESQLSMKEIIKIRKACMALAFEMYQTRGEKAEDGVLSWKILTEGNEVNEVKNEWIW